MSRKILFVAAAAFFLAPVAQAHDEWLPLGDGKISTVPQAGYIFSCQQNFDPSRAGAGHAGNWIQGAQWNPDGKPTVSGAVSWPGAAITISIENGLRIIRANSLPLHPSGVFPIQPADEAYSYDRNPNSIRAQSILLSLPANPVAAAQASCVPMGMIGMALTGVAIFNGLDAGGRDAAAHEIQDSCGGHPQQQGQYHYHSLSPCLTDNAGKAGQHSDLVGYALDGFGIYGQYGENGKKLTDADLDECHGHTHAIMWNGKMQVMYHYHMTGEYPYTLGCFRGTPVSAPGGQAQGRGGQDDRRRILEAAARELGLDPGTLGAALGPPPPDFSAAAQKLGIDEARLREAFRKARQSGQPGQ